MTPALRARALWGCLGAGALNVAALNLLVQPARLNAKASRPEPSTVQSRHARAGALVPMQRAGMPSALQPELTPLPGKPEPRGGELFLVLEFSSSAHWLDSGAADALNGALDRLRSAPQITIVGHADGTGAAELNERLSAVRANVVARRLFQAGIEPRRVHVDWRGAGEPRGTGENKRVEIYLGESR